MFRQRSEDPPLCMLGVRIECRSDARQLAWLLERCGAAPIRAAAVRRTLGLAPRPAAIAAELDLRIPDQSDLPDLPELPWQPEPGWTRFAPLRSRRRREAVHPA